MNTTLFPPADRSFQDTFMNQPPRGPRFMLWVDGVGGYLVCLGDTVRIGQAVPGSPVEIPVIGDLSRHHVTLGRVGEGYYVDPLATVTLGGARIVSRRHLVDGDELQLGASFRIRFRQPHPLSASACLEFVSHHRSQPSCDGVVLMAGSCLLGPAPGNHVVCRDWERDLVLVRQGQALACHSQAAFDVDGKSVERRAPITLDSRIQGTDFCISLERFE